MNPLASLDNLVLNGFEKVTQYAAKQDFSKYDLLKGSDYARGIGDLALAAYAAIQIPATEGSVSKAGYALMGALFTYFGANSIKNAKKTNEWKELREYRGGKLISNLSAEEKPHHTAADVFPNEGNPSRVALNGFFAVIGAGMMYFTHHLPTFPTAQQVFYDIFLTVLIGGSIAKSYFPDTSLLLSPQRQAQLEAKLEQEKV